MKYYLIAGEAFGDLHGSNLIKELKKCDPEAEFRFFGGDLMQAQGGTLVRHYKDMAFMGFVNVLLNLRKVLGNMSACKKDIKRYKPDAVILIDYPSFNLKIAQYVKRKRKLKKTPVFYYISPKIWAWKEHRIHAIRKYIDRVFCILPFEVPYYQKHRLDVTYVGNPSVDSVAFRECKDETIEEFTSRNNLAGKEIIAILAGSRKQEIKKCLPVMMKAVEKFTRYQFVIAGAPGIDPALYDKYLYRNPRFGIVFGQTYNLLQHSSAAVINSGTASLEAALFNVPQVVGYHVMGGKLARWIFQRLIKVKWASLVNLISGKLVMKEFLADEFTSENLERELYLILRDEEYRNEMLKNYAEMQKTLGETGASRRTAEEIYKRIQHS